MLIAKSRESAKTNADKGLGDKKPKSETSDRLQANQLWTQFATRVHPKLTISSSSDPCELEADRVANQVMRMPNPVAQQACPACAAKAPFYSNYQDEEIPAIHRKMDDSGGLTGTSVPECFHLNLGPGQPLDTATRAFMEPRFGRSFADVRLHLGSQAATSAHAIAAKAYTVGNDIAFGAGRFDPMSGEGRALLAHELTHVAQQSAELPSPLVSHRVSRCVARAPLDLVKVDDELKKGGPLSLNEGEIGHAATVGKRMDPPSEDTSPGMEIKAHVFQKTVPSTPPAAGSSPTSKPVPAQRALIVAGFHGDERGPLDLVDRMLAELRTGATPRDFDVIVIPHMNPWGIAHHDRFNARSVDLNRNFPGLSGFPSTSERVPPQQPEVTAVMKAVTILHPSRILAMHAIGDTGMGGAFSDPVEGPARDLAARMALRMRGAKNENVKGNEIQNQIFSSLYPLQGEVDVTTKASSLGAWASAPTAAGGRSIPVITHEVAGKGALPATGTGRSVDTIIPGLNEFLLDRTGSPNEGDALLTKAVSDAFLQGEQITSTDRKMLSAIERTVKRRFDMLNAHYKNVWLPALKLSDPKKASGLPAKLSDVSTTRSFAKQASIITDQLALHKITAWNTGTPILDRLLRNIEVQNALKKILETRSMPGFSRHHWGTEIDVSDVERTHWEGSGPMVPLISFMQTETMRFGFFHPYSSGAGGLPGFPRPVDPHYLNEPWHISYWPIANVLAEQWAARFTGAVLDALIDKTADAIKLPGITKADMKMILLGLNLASFQTNVAKSP